MAKKVWLGALLLVVVATSLFWLNRDAWLADFNAERAEQKEQYQRAGLDFGKQNDQQACLNEALQSFDGCLGYSCTVNNGVFLKACLSQATATPGFCDGVPEFRDKPTEDDKSWAKYFCWDNNIRGEGCRLLMRQQAFFCSNPP
ncbi:hypothetical protein [Neptunomonas sp. XY-337]|uniref:hypothetical protein n=1 Tax=Neptunomonas sp. XY-337 TaxID=2561897 RepID=UPI001F0E9E5A|nr:hypothetical protein [Neptunomonas sp. XY-337]